MFDGLMMIMSYTLLYYNNYHDLLVKVLLLIVTPERAVLWLLF